MKDIYKDYLFGKRILVSEPKEGEETAENAFNVLTSLGLHFNICIRSNANLATMNMIHDARRNLGYYVPESFYRGFPETVRKMTKEQLLYDQLLHYTKTYGFGWFEEAGHSELEETATAAKQKEFEQMIALEPADIKNFDILNEADAEEKMKEFLQALMGSSRPLKLLYDQLLLLHQGYTDYGKAIVPEKMPCKDTVIRFLYYTKDLFFCKFLMLSDVIKLVNYIQYSQYGSENLKKLNLRNQDRKLITKTIDELSRRMDHKCDYNVCFEKRKLWCGLMHHLHYQPKTSMMEQFMKDIRSNKNFSVYSYMENNIRNGNIPAAANILRQMKSNADLIRHLDYLLSRCPNQEAVTQVMDHLAATHDGHPDTNPVVLAQMLIQYHERIHGYSGRKDERTFVFNRNNRMRVHKETDEEKDRRRTILPLSTLETAKQQIESILRKTLKNRIGKVWIDTEMYKIAVPIDLSSGQDGFGILPTGSRMDIPEGKFVRAFTYWEKVNDIDLSAFAIDRSGKRQEFSWRNMYSRQSEAITYSGDQTSGYDGGSEYFDIDLEAFRRMYPEFRYIIFCNNVYSQLTFDKCECKAGYMIRQKDMEEMGWKGSRNEDEHPKRKVFDPRTVSTSFEINANSTFAYLFAIDLEKREMVWLNKARKEEIHVAGMSDMDFLLRYLSITEAFNVGMLYSMAGTEVDRIEDADVIVSDFVIGSPGKEGQAEIVRSWDIEKMLGLLKT